MKRACDIAERAVWEHVRNGADLPDDVIRHMDVCASCSGLPEEVRLISAGLSDAARVPDSPDCRSAVMSKISAAKSGRPIWVYAAACIVLLALLAVGLLRDGYHGAPRVADGGAQGIVRQQVDTPVERESPADDPPLIIDQLPDRVVPPSPPVRQVNVRRQPRPAPVHVDVEPPQQDVPEEPEVALDETAPEIEPTPVDRPIAIVSVSWSSVDDQADQSYSYAETDRETGCITICRVEKTAEGTTIHMETIPGPDMPGGGA